MKPNGEARCSPLKSPGKGRSALARPGLITDQPGGEVYDQSTTNTTTVTGGNIGAVQSGGQGHTAHVTQTITQDYRTQTLALIDEATARIAER